MTCGYFSFFDSNAINQQITFVMITAIRLKVDEHFKVFPIDLFTFLFAPSVVCWRLNRGFTECTKTGSWFKLGDLHFKRIRGADPRSGLRIRKMTQRNLPHREVKAGVFWRVIFCFRLLSNESAYTSLEMKRRLVALRPKICPWKMRLLGFKF